MTLSPQQKRINKLKELEFTPYLVQCAIEVLGKVCFQKLLDAVWNLLESNDVFHSTSQQRETMIIQIDIRDLSYEQQKERVKEEIILNKKFKDEIRLVLFDLSQDQYIILIQAPATVLDGHHSALIDRLAELYQGNVNDNNISYKAIANWLNDFQESEDSFIGWNMWESYNNADHLMNFSKKVLPYEYEQVKTDSCQNLNFEMDNELLKKIRMAANQANITVEDIMYTAWNVWIGRMTNETEVVTCVNFDGRMDEALKNYIGPLSIYVPIQSTLRWDEYFVDTVSRFSKIKNEIENWQDSFCWEKMSNKFKLDIFHLPVGFDYQKVEPITTSHEVTFRYYNDYFNIECFKFRLSCIELEESLTLKLYYDSSRFDEKDIYRLFDSFQTLLKASIEQIYLPIKQLPLINASDFNKIIHQWNCTENGARENVCLHELFEEQVKHTPHQTAVISNDINMNYYDLNQHANKLANKLIDFGVKNEEIVVLFMERSSEVPIGSLGIMKAGAAYLPIDPKFPYERIKFMIEDSGARVIITQKKYAAIAAQLGLEVVIVHAMEPLPAIEIPDPQIGIHEGNLAYSIYTSGSTGKPKGALLEHRNIVNHLQAINEKIPFGAGDHCAYLSTFAADVGHTILYGSLTTGGILHIISEELGSEPEKLSQYFTRYGIDFLKVVPSHLASLLGNVMEELLPRKFLLLGGEELRWEWVRKLSKVSNCLIFNHYGPTETAVGTFLYQVTEDQPTRRAVPIGKPMSNTKAYILDSFLQPVPIGSAGELYIAGRSVGRGYINRPSLTEEKYLLNPFVHKEERMYKTGDMVRHLENGDIEFIERVDHQVKVRGFRVEIGEVENNLDQHPYIEKSIVMANPKESGQFELVAYLVLKEGINSLDITPLRNFLLNRLPEYMIPSTYRILEKFPLTFNGKIDRLALTELANVNEISMEKEYVQATTFIEKELESIWMEVLEMDKISVLDDFFSIGGYSLTAIKINTRIRQLFNIDLPVRIIFENPTISSLANAIEEILLTELKGIK